MESFQLLELYLWGTVGLYCLASVCFVYYASFPKSWLLTTARYLTVVGFVVHLIAVLYRWQLAGHGPYRTIHEILVCNSSFIVLLYLGISWRWRKYQFLGVFVIPLALMFMGGGMLASREVLYLSPSVQSPWLVVHVIFAKMAVASVVLATGLSVAMLVRNTGLSRLKQVEKVLSAVDDLRQMCFQLIQAAFIFATLMIIAGAIWANDAWGRYWDWDAIEIWSLITWALYGFILHLRMYRNVTENILAGFIVLALVSSLMAAFIVPLVAQSIHSMYFK